MSGHIQRLPALLANRIAAGEVVERPASVVRELLDNALDAGATRIRIDVEAGGSELVRVDDDGEGIAGDELLLAVERHATSKLRTEDDLWAIGTLGFRGEALPSIASVSRFELISRRAGDAQAMRVFTDADGVICGPAPAARGAGTVVSVRDLFFGVPARRRFLKGERTELRHVREHVQRAALCYPGTAFTLRHGGRTLLEMPAAPSLGARVERALGADFARHAVPVDAIGSADGTESGSGGPMQLSGWMRPPSQTRRAAQAEHLFVNGRPVSDRLLRHAVRQAAEQAGLRAPDLGFVLFLELDPAQVDVNVHPAKLEVRFRESRQVHDFVRRALRDALGGGHSLFGGEEPVAGADLPSPAEAAGARYGGPSNDGARADGSGARGFSPARPPGQGSSGRALWQFHAGGGVAEGPDAPCVRIGSTGIVVGDEALLLVDLAARLRESLRSAWREASLEADSAAPLVSRPLLVPARVPLDEADVAALEPSLETLSALGLDIRVTGPAAASLRRIPDVCEPFAADVLVLAAARAATTVTQVGVMPLADALVANLERCDGFEAAARTLSTAATQRLLAGVAAGTPGARRLDDAALSAILSGDG